MKSRSDDGRSDAGQWRATRAQSTPFKKRQQKHTKRLGGGGLSLEAFAAAKSKPFTSPAQIREHREGYQNAKKVQKYKKLVAQLGGHDRGLRNEETAGIPGKVQDKEIAIDKSASEKRSGVGFPSRKLPLLDTHGKQYNHRRKQLQRPKDISQMERDKVRKNEFEEKEKDVDQVHGEEQEAREKLNHDNKVTQVRLRKKTQRGQPVMKHQMERLLEVIQRTS